MQTSAQKKIRSNSHRISALSEVGIEKLFEKEVVASLFAFIVKALIQWFDTFPWGKPLTPLLVFLLVVVIVVMALIFLDTIPRNDFD
jgi:CBS domain containing-hemolysin-like protein